MFFADGFKSIAFALAACCVAAPAPADVIHDESLHGDLSGDRAVPTAYTLRVGANSVIATTMFADLEYLALTIPAGRQLGSLVLASYAGIDQTGFIAVQRGSTFTEPPGNPNVRNLLGWTHFGPDFNHVGTDILDDLGCGPGSMQFTPPLDAGIYTFWIQQTGQDPATYQLDFMVVPGTGAVAAFAAGGVVATRRRRP